ncbi:hypothetical protein [Rothia nasimurium]|uniref:hypothetical protein n=1 Tax=Rothia nasimurium TaxID=85336 RepID=UPI001F2211F8|nr:hypothetical protein [Rothia nasimurium]
MTSTFPPISVPTACIWIDGDAAEAATYSPNPSISGFLRFSPDRFGSLEQAEQALRHAHSAIGEGTFHDFTFDPGVSITLLYQDQAGIDGAWSVLSQVADVERCG